jgi:hypothetical protein
MNFNQHIIQKIEIHSKLTDFSSNEVRLGNCRTQGDLKDKMHPFSGLRTLNKRRNQEITKIAILREPNRS